MNNKTILIGLGVLAVAGIGYYMWKKKSKTTTTTLKLKQDTTSDVGGDAKDTDAIGQQYTLLTNYKAMNTKTMKDVDFKGSDKNVFVKKADRNGTNMNMQDAVKVFLGTDEYVIPTNILKKSGGASTSSENKDSKVVALFADMAANPPKSEQEAKDRAAKFGLTKDDITAYNEKQKQVPNTPIKVTTKSEAVKKYNLKDIGFPAAMVWNGGQDFTQTSIMPSEMPFKITGKEMTAYNIPLAETSVLNKGKSVWVNKTALQPVS